MVAALPALFVVGCASGLHAECRARAESAGGIVVVLHHAAPELERGKDDVEYGRSTAALRSIIEDEVREATGLPCDVAVVTDYAEFYGAIDRKDKLILYCGATTYGKSSGAARTAHVAGDVGLVLLWLVSAVPTAGATLAAGPALLPRKENLSARLVDPRDDRRLWEKSDSYWKGALRDEQTAQPKIHAFSTALRRAHK